MFVDEERFGDSAETGGVVGIDQCRKRDTNILVIPLGRRDYLGIEGDANHGEAQLAVFLENFLPQRFGGSPLDYQLIEEEDRQGLTRLILAVDPSIEIDDEEQVVTEVLAQLGASSPMANEARQIWQQAETIRVRRQKPIWTKRGKLMSLYVQKRYESP